MPDDEPRIDPRVESVPIWLVWSQMIDGATLLRAVCLTAERAERYCADLESRRSLRVTRLHVEASYANHLYAGEFSEPV